MFAKSNIPTNQNQPLSLVANDEKTANRTNIHDDDNYDVVKNKLKRLIFNLPQNRTVPYSIEQLAQLSNNVSILTAYFDQANNQNKDILINVYRAIANPKNNAMNFHHFVNQKAREYSHTASEYTLLSVLSSIAGIVSYAAMCFFSIPTLGISTFGTFVPLGLFVGAGYTAGKAKEAIRTERSLKNIANIVEAPERGLGSLTDLNDGDSYDVIKYKLQRFIFNLPQNEDALYTVEQQTQLSNKVTTLLTYFDQEKSSDQNKEILMNIYRAISDPKNHAQNFQGYVNEKAQEYSHKANKYSWLSVLSFIASVVSFVASCALVVPTCGFSLFGLGASAGLNVGGLYYSDKVKESIRVTEDLKNIANITAKPKLG